MSKTILITEDQLKVLIQSTKLENLVQEDYASDLKKQLQVNAKKPQVQKCPIGYKQLTQQEIQAHSKDLIKPWADTRAGDHGYTTLKNGIICRSDRRSKLEQGPSNITLDQIVENVRSGMGSIAGIVLQVLIEFIPGIGPLINTGAWSLLLGYDVIYKGIMSKKWNWFNIIVDLIGVITTGPGGGIVKQGLSKIAGYGTKSLKTFIGAIKKYAPKTLQYIKPLISKVSSVVGGVVSFFSKLLNMVATKLKGGQLYNTILKLKNGLGGLTGILHQIESALALVVGHQGASVTAKVGEKYGEEQLVHAGVGSVTGGGHHG